MNYDKIAAIYDRLSRLVYGNVLRDMQVGLLRAVPPGSRILIAGGGTGWILEALARVQPSGLNIDYVEASGRMMQISEKRNAGENNIRFICANVQDANLQSAAYDVVFTAFLFDNFSQATARQVFAAIDKQLKHDGLWLYADFCNTNRPGYRLLLRIMYLFFRVTCGIEAKRLPEVEALFIKEGYRETARSDRMQGFITSVVYKKCV